MKKLFVLFSLTALMGLFANNVNAQQYFTYDGDAFNTYIKTNSANTQVLEIYFTDAAKSKWVQFQIVDYYTYGDGFQYVVKDAKGKKFYYDYFSGDMDNVVVSDDAGNTWTLYRRK